MTTRSPTNLKGPGLRLWKTITEDYELAAHEQALLEEVCRVRSRIAELDAVVADEGLMGDSSQGRRVNPAVTEARQQRLLFAKLCSQLRIPTEDDT